MSTVASLAPIADSHAPCIVIIDDEAYICALVSEILADEGYSVSIARNGEEGLRTILRTRPNLIITDIMMPGMSGLDVVGQVRQTPVVAATPVIVMSAGRQPSNLAHDIRFIAKPFDIFTLLKRVEELIGTP